MKKRITVLKPLNHVKPKSNKKSKNSDEETIKRLKEIEENKYLIPEDFFNGF